MGGICNVLAGTWEVVTFKVQDLVSAAVAVVVTIIAVCSLGASGPLSGEGVFAATSLVTSAGVITVAVVAAVLRPTPPPCSAAGSDGRST